MTSLHRPRDSRLLRRLRHGLESVLTAEIDMEGLEVREVAAVLAARAAEITGRDAVVYQLQRGFPQVLACTRATPPDWAEHQDDVVAALRRRAPVLRVRATLPITSGSRCDTALSVDVGRVSLDDVHLALLRLLTWQAGAAFERCTRAAERQHSLDTVSGGALLAALEPGDVLAVVQVDGDDLAVQRLGVQLWERVRADDRIARVGPQELAVLLRQVHGSVEQVLQKVAGDELQRDASAPFYTGAALHLPHRAPVETIDAAREALEVAGRARVLMAVASETR